MKITKANLSKILRESVFTPKNDRGMAIIADVGNYQYYITRANEELAKLHFSPQEQDQALKMVISLLALARLELQK